MIPHMTEYTLNDRWPHPSLDLEHICTRLSPEHPSAFETVAAGLTPLSYEAADMGQVPF